MASLSTTISFAGFSCAPPPKPRRAVVVRAEGINPDIRKTEDKVVDSVVVTELAKPLTAYCRAAAAGNEQPASVVNVAMSRRGLVCLNLTAAAASLLAFGGFSNRSSYAAILEADDDLELMEKVKRDRKKRLEKQGVISSSSKETVYIQDLVYKLSEVGQAIEKNDLSAASSVLGPSKDTEWFKKANSALNMLSSSSEEKTEVDTFNISLATLIAAVSKNDIEASKVAFFESASAFERWTALSGLVELLKGL